MRLFLLLLVFVHKNGHVALQEHAGDASSHVLGKGREPSTDGARVFYWTDEGIVVGDAASGKETLWRKGNLRSPELSPDGRQLIFGEMVDGDWAVKISPSARDESKLLFRAPGEGVYHAAWQPDGRGVVTAGLDHVYFVGLDGTLQRTLPVADLRASISSSDRFRVDPQRPMVILFSSEVEASPAVARALRGDGASSALFLYDLTTKQRTRLTGDDVFATDPAWSRDGAQIYFRGLRAGKQPLREGVLQIDREGKKLIRLIAGSEPNG